MTILLLLILLLETNLSLESYLFLLSLLFITNNNNFNLNPLPSIFYYKNNTKNPLIMNSNNTNFRENIQKTTDFPQKIDMIYDYDKNSKNDDIISISSKPIIIKNNTPIYQSHLNHSSNSFQNNIKNNLNNHSNENITLESDNINENSIQNYYDNSNLLDTIKSQLNADNYRSDGSVDMQCTIDALAKYNDNTITSKSTPLNKINYSIESLNNYSFKNIDKAFKGQSLNVVMSPFGLITGEVFLNLNQIIVLRLKNSKLIHINKKYISYFY